MKAMFVLYYLSVSSMLLLSGCTTYSVTVIHSEGTASDLVDLNQAQSPSTDVKADANLPQSLIK